MKRTMKFIALLFTFLIVITGYVHATNDSKNIYVVPIREEITNATVGYLEKAIKAAESGGYDALVIELDTYGGLVDAAESIKNLIMGTSLDTICFIEVKYRKDASFGMPQEAVDRNKQKKILIVSAYYRTLHQIDSEVSIRYDVVAILGNRIKVIKNAFGGI